MTRGKLVAAVFVPGRARTKGHMTPGAGGVARDRALLQAWMRTLNGAIQRQLGIRIAGPRGKRVRVDGGAPYAGDVEVHAFFRFERELSEAQRAEAGSLKPSHQPPWPTTIGIGDEDTLRRAVLDALVKAGVIRDDSLCVGGMNYKRWCEEGEEAGVLIAVRTVEQGGVLPALLAALEVAVVLP